MDHKLSNMKLYGPGMWFCIHTMAKRAVHMEAKIEFKNFVLTLRDNMKCVECKMHFVEYIEKNPIENFFTFLYKGQDLGCFVWAWKFHNTVNSRLQKEQVTLEKALEMYSQEACTDCTLDIGKDQFNSEERKPKYSSRK